MNSSDCSTNTTVSPRLARSRSSVSAISSMIEGWMPSVGSSSRTSLGCRTGSAPPPGSAARRPQHAAGAIEDRLEPREVVEHGGDHLIGGSLDCAAAHAQIVEHAQAGKISRPCGTNPRPNRARVCGAAAVMSLPSSECRRRSRGYGRPASQQRGLAHAVMSEYAHEFARAVTLRSIPIRIGIRPYPDCKATISSIGWLRVDLAYRDRRRAPGGRAACRHIVLHQHRALMEDRHRRAIMRMNCMSCSTTISGMAPVELARRGRPAVRLPHASCRPPARRAGSGRAAAAMTIASSTICRCPCASWPTMRPAMRDADPLHRLVGAPVGDCGRAPTCRAGDPDVLAHAETVEDVGDLRLDADAAARDVVRCGLPVIGSPRNSTSPRGRLELPGQALEERALAGTVRPDEAAQLAPRSA